VPAPTARGFAVAVVSAFALLALLTQATGGTAALRATGGRAPARAATSETPTPGALYKSGPSGRYLLGGTWLLRLDHGVGLRQHFEDSRSSHGWTAVTVPNAWNAGNTTNAGYAPTVAWYRKDFVLPSSAPRYTWIVRFESINNSVTIWLNGHQIAAHTGAFLAFEVVLPASDLNLRTVNRLVLRVSDAHSQTDLPALSRPGPHGVVGGWWNYGGLLREVYLRRVERIDFDSVQVLPRLSCASCDARVSYSVVVHNFAAATQRVAVSTRYGAVAARLGERTIGAGASATFVGQLTIPHPLLWSPSTPHTYAVSIDASAAPARARPLVALAHYVLESGIREVSVIAGHLYLNYKPLHVRGVGLIEDSPAAGSALSPAQQLALLTRAKQLGATMIRSQYPLSAYEEQLADELGIMLWSEIPVYQVRESKLSAVTPTALALLRENILENGNHPAIAIWSIGNELQPFVSPAQSAYIAAAVSAAHRLDSTRPVGLAFQGYPAIGCQAAYAPLQVLGINDYFGWYTGPAGQIADISVLADYLAQEHACYPKQATMVTEFGAEANRTGPVDERGTFEFQSQYLGAQLAAFTATPWLSGAIYWALQDFLVRPGWTGGNPYPSSPIFNKGLLDFSGAPKPAWTLAQQAYQATPQVG
jgi:beta-glucuronidase